MFHGVICMSNVSSTNSGAGTFSVHMNSSHCHQWDSCSSIFNFL